MKKLSISLLAVFILIAASACSDGLMMHKALKLKQDNVTKEDATLSVYEYSYTLNADADEWKDIKAYVWHENDFDYRITVDASTSSLINTFRYFQGQSQKYNFVILKNGNVRKVETLKEAIETAIGIYVTENYSETY